MIIDETETPDELAKAYHNGNGKHVRVVIRSKPVSVAVYLSMATHLVLLTFYPQDAHGFYMLMTRDLDA